MKTSDLANLLIATTISDNLGARPEGACKTPTWAAVTRYLAKFETCYPTILDWCAKIQCELLLRKRGVFAFVDAAGVLSGLAITKNAELAKLCHISVSDEVRHNGVGAALMNAAVKEMLEMGARRVHVTTGEEVASTYGDVFRRFGFVHQNTRRGRYRHGVDELGWDASHEVLRERALNAPLHDGCSIVRLKWNF